MLPSIKYAIDLILISDILNRFCKSTRRKSLIVIRSNQKKKKEITNFPLNLPTLEKGTKEEIALVVAEIFVVINLWYSIKMTLMGKKKTITCEMRKGKRD